MIILDEVTRKLLVTAKLLFNQALLFAHRGSISDTILAVITFDLANETVLGAALSSLDSKAKFPDKRHFPDKLDRIAEILSEHGLDLPNKPQVLRVHDLRNDAQHRAKYPTSDELDDCRIHTREFLTNLVQLVWNEDFTRIKLADLVKHEDVRMLLTQAEDQLAARRYVDATRSVATAFERAIAKTEAHLVGKFPWGISPRVPSVLEEEIRSSDLHQFTQTMEKVRETVLAISLGIRPLDLARYRSLTGYPRLMADGNIVSNSSTEGISDADAEWVFNMCIDSILRIEQTVGDLDIPFDQKYWF